MKYTITLVLLAFCLTIHGQKIKAFYFDDFEQVEVLETTWESVRKSGISPVNGSSFFRIVRVDTSIYLEYKKGVTFNLHTINIDNFMIKVDSEIIKLSSLNAHSSEPGIAKKGLSNIGRHGFYLTFKLSEENIDTFLNCEEMEKSRLMTNQGHLEDKWGKKHTKKFKQALRLALDGEGE